MWAKFSRIFYQYQVLPLKRAPECLFLQGFWPINARSPSRVPILRTQKTQIDETLPFPYCVHCPDLFDIIYPVLL